MKRQLDATLYRFYFCRVTLHVSGASAHHQEYLKLVQWPLVHVLSLQVSHHISLFGPELNLNYYNYLAGCTMSPHLPAPISQLYCILPPIDPANIWKYIITCNQPVLKPLTPNYTYRARTAPLTCKRCILYIYSTNIGTKHFKHGIFSSFFSLKTAAGFIILTY